jgi:transcription antitermination factor NusG
LEKVVKTDKEIKNLWYSIRVISGKERTVEENIKYETDANNVDDLVEEIFVPFEKIFPQLNHQHY